METDTSNRRTLTPCVRNCETMGAHRVVGGANLRWYTPESLLSELLRSTPDGKHATRARQSKTWVVSFRYAPLLHAQKRGVRRSTYRKHTPQLERLDT